MTEVLSLGTIDHADKPLLPRCAKRIGNCVIVAKIQQKRWFTTIVTQPFKAARQGRLDVFDLHFAIPIRRASDLPCVSTEADQRRLIAIALTTKLADVKLA